MYVCGMWWDNIPEDLSGETAASIYNGYQCRSFWRSGTQYTNQWDEDTSFESDMDMRDAPRCTEHGDETAIWDDRRSSGDIAEEWLIENHWYACEEHTSALWFRNDDEYREHRAIEQGEDAADEEEPVDEWHEIYEPIVEPAPDWQTLPWTAEPPLPEYAVPHLQDSIDTNNPRNSYGTHTYDLRMPITWVYTNEARRHDMNQGISIRREDDRIRPAILSGGWIEHHITYGPRATSTHGIWQ